MGMGRSCQQRDITRYEHYYHFDILIQRCVRFTVDGVRWYISKETMKLLILCSILDTRDGFRSFSKDDICSLVEKLYPWEFTPFELYALKLQLELYGDDILSWAPEYP